MNGLGHWMIVIEWLNKATIMFNCLFLFWFRRHFAESINDKFGFLKFMFPPTSGNNLEEKLNLLLADADDAFRAKIYSKVPEESDALQDHEIMQFFIILMFIEHFIILFKFFLEEWIPDTPPFVERRAIKVQ